VTYREQELVDQMRSWRAQLDATPEPAWDDSPPALDLDPREQRLADARARRSARLARPLSSPEPTPADRPAPAALQLVGHYDLVVDKADAEFAKWKRDIRYRRQYGRTRGGRNR